MSKLKAVPPPAPDADFKLEDVVDIPMFQELQDRLHRVYEFPSAIIDNDGKILTATGWQDVCVKFHRPHPECAKECVKSDQYILSHIHEANPAVTYTCPHGLVDNAIPIVIAGKHLANYFTGQIFLEPPDLEFFKKQAPRYGFDEKAYLEAVRRVPVWSRKKLAQYLDFIKGFVEVLATLGHTSLKERQERLASQAAQKENTLRQRLLESIAEGTSDAIYVKDLEGRYLLFNKAAASFVGRPAPDVLGKDDTFLFKPEEARTVMEEDRRVMESGETRTYEERVTTADGMATRFLSTKGPVRDEAGKVVGLFGIARDITKLKEADLRLKKLNEQLKAAQRLGKVGGWEWDLRTGTVYWSEELRQINGHDPSLPVPKFEEMSSFYTPESWKRLTEAVERAFREKRSYELQLDLVRPDRTIRRTVARGEPVLDREGDLVGLVGSVQDVTEQEEAHAALKRSQDTLQSILDESGTVCFLKDLEGRYITVNRIFEKLFHVSRKTLSGKTDHAIFPKEFADHFQRHDRLALEKGSPLEVEETVPHDDGQHTYISVKFPIKDKDGKPYAVCGIATDITERKRADDTIRASEEKYRALVETTDTGFLILDHEGRVLDANREYVRLTGRRGLDDILGRPVTDWTAEHEKEKNAKAVAQCIRDRFIRNFLVEYSGPDGKLTPVEINATVTGTGKDMRIISLCRDITDRRKAAESLATLHKLESLGVMAGGIAHDFNNILTTILGNLSLLRSSQPGSDNRGIVKEAEEACGVAKGLAHQLLTFAQGGNPVVKVMDLRPVVTQAAKFGTAGSNSRCVFDLGEAPLSVNIDRDQVAQVIQNLVLNACQSMPEGGDITIRASTVLLKEGEVPSLPAGHSVRVTVEDQGEGIPPAHLSKVFDPYFSTKSAGRGLGLSVCFSIMTKHRGHISAASRPGEGAVFTLYFPASEAPASGTEERDRKAEPGSGRILVMDDEAAVAKVLGRMLQRLGYQVESTRDGKSALEAYAKAMASGRPFDAVILDLTIPGGMGGKDALAGLKKLDPKVKAIVSSGYANDPVMSDFAAHGFSGVMTKPFIVEELAQILASVLGRKTG